MYDLVLEALIVYESDAEVLKKYLHLILVLVAMVFVIESSLDLILSFYSMLV